MKCPKCGYLGFEHVDRCRNCGYEFSLAAPTAGADLPIKAEADSLEALDDFSFIDRVPSSDPVERVVRPAAAPAAAAPASVSAELPLFGGPIPDDLPLITRPSPPRPPLAVRRATPEVPRLRSVPPRAPSLDLAFDAASSGPAPGATEAAGVDRSASAERDAGVAARLAAFLLDTVILAAIDAAVVYFTMQICGVGLEDLAILPRTPLIAFLVLQNGGYLVAFTAGGQTLGKMAAGIKVVAADAHEPVRAGRAFVRELARFVLALPAGVGLLPALFSRDHRGLHDRFAGTRVVRA